MTGRPVIETRGLTRAFGEFVAVDGVSLAVQAGEVFGFLGPNGAGKTTTIKMLAGLLAPTAGAGEVAGLAIGRDSARIRERIGYMSQLFSLYGDLTVLENITFFSRLYGVPREERAARRDWVLEMARLGPHRHRRTGDLPLGWKQRLALGCAVLHRPAILFLDEPTSGVDPVSRRSFWDLIHEMAEGGTTVLVSTHYMEEAEHCHRLALMNRGRLVALDTPPALRASLTLPILELDTDDPPVAVEALLASGRVVDAALFGRMVHATVEGTPDEARAALSAALAARGVTLRHLEPVTPSLEDVFVALVRRGGGAVVG